MKFFRSFLPVVLVAAGLQIASSAPATAASVSCRNSSTAPASGYDVSINGTLTAPSEPGRFDKYWVLVCRDTGNRDYNVYAGLYDANTDGGQGRFTAADLNTEFKVSFVPDSGTVPMVAQGHGKMSAFTIDANDSNRVTLVTKPISYSDIYGSDCGNLGPAECVLAVKNTNGDKASADNIEVRVSIRYADSPGGGESDFAILKGMHWSSSAYYFWMRTTCPTTNGSGQSGISLEVGGPHFKKDGTLNIGDITVFIPAGGVVACFGAPPSVVASSLAVSRTVNGTTDAVTTGTSTDVGLQYTVTSDDATGLTVTVPQVTFSKPTYTVGTKSGKSLAKKTKTYASLLKLAKMKKPSGGSYRVTSKSPKVCAGAVSKIHAFRAGTCKVSVVTYTKSGKKSASRSVSFRVGS